MINYVNSFLFKFHNNFFDEIPCFDEATSLESSMNDVAFSDAPFATEVFSKEMSDGSSDSGVECKNTSSPHVHTSLSLPLVNSAAPLF